MHICGFDFDVVIMEDDSFFLEDRFPNFDRDVKNKKIGAVTQVGQKYPY